jgi:predicted MFS family arabinose efflux permease
LDDTPDLMAGVLPLVALTDRIPARTIYLVCSTLSALSCFGIAMSGSLTSALVWRAVGGIALAGMYMPGLRALTDGMAGTRRARAAAWYTSSFTLGSSLSFLLGQAGLLWNWRAAFLVSGALGGIGVLLAWAALPRMNTEAAAEHPRAMADLRQAFGNRDVLVLIIGYAATIWGTAGLRQWIVVFLAFCAADQPIARTTTALYGSAAAKPNNVWLASSCKAISPTSPRACSQLPSHGGEV